VGDELHIVRVRIIRRLTGNVDGIDLRPFEPGVVYELSTALGSYLLCVGVAEPADDSPAVAMPLSTALLTASGRGLTPPPERGTIRQAPSARRNLSRSRNDKRE